jgi:hypothetical protein
LPTTLRELKLGILRVLAGRRHQHKTNLLGRPRYPGDLERELKLDFTPEQRTLADSAIEQLKTSGLVRPTYADISDPQNWLEITAEGKEALDRGACDALDAALAELGEHLVDMRAEAFAALARGTEESVRQASHSGRELIGQTLRLGAPDEAVKEQPWFTPDSTSKSGITRRHRLRYVMQATRGSSSDSDLRIAERACDLVLEIHNRLTAASHSCGSTEAGLVRELLAAAEMALKLVMLSDSAAD